MLPEGANRSFPSSRGYILLREGFMQHRTHESAQRRKTPSDRGSNLDVADSAVLAVRAGPRQVGVLAVDRDADQLGAEGLEEACGGELWRSCELAKIFVLTRLM